MSLGFVFWLLMLLWLVFGFYIFWPRTGTGTGSPNWSFIGGNGFIFVLLVLLGCKVFGWPVTG